MRLELLTTTLVALCALPTAAGQNPASHPRSSRASTTQAHPSRASLPSEAEVTAFLGEMFGYDPQLRWKVSSIVASKAEGLAEVNVEISSPQGQGTQRFFVAQDGKYAVVGDIIPFGMHPFEEARQELEKGVTGPARGPRDSPITIVEFSDLQCPHCKEANPTIDRLLSEQPNVRFIFQNFPLPMHNWAQKAAAYADCVARASEEAFWKFLPSVYAAQAEITLENVDPKLSELADKAGVKGEEVAACAARPETQSRVEASLDLGRSLDVKATPTLFINGRPVGVGANNYEVLKKLVVFAGKQK